jgi:hypothetical protein
MPAQNARRSGAHGRPPAGAPCMRGSLGRQRPNFRLAAGGELKAALALAPVQKSETGDTWSPVCVLRTLHNDWLTYGDAASEPGRQ